MYVVLSDAGRLTLRVVPTTMRSAIKPHLEVAHVGYSQEGLHQWLVNHCHSSMPHISVYEQED